MLKLSIFFVLFRRWHSEEGWWGFGCCPTTVSPSAHPPDGIRGNGWEIGLVTHQDAAY
jgi:hypothetical protein